MASPRLYHHWLYAQESLQYSVASSVLHQDFIKSSRKPCIVRMYRFRMCNFRMKFRYPFCHEQDAHYTARTVCRKHFALCHQPIHAIGEVLTRRR